MAAAVSAVDANGSTASIGAGALACDDAAACVCGWYSPECPPYGTDTGANVDAAAVAAAAAAAATAADEDGCVG